MNSSFLRSFFSAAAGLLIFGNLSFGQDEEEVKPIRGEDLIRVPAIGEGLSVSNSFQSHMVIQRDKPIAVWGWAETGEEVTVSFAGNSAKATAADDRAWKVELPATTASSEPQKMTIQGKSNSLDLEDILVGDVWVLGGQSNMEFEIAKVDDGMLEIVSANFPEIRLLTIPRGKGFDSVASFERIHEWSSWSSRHFKKGDWEVCSPETVREFSAIGYVFGRRLHMAAGIPIGLIDASVGGTTVETWTPEAVITEIEGAETKELLQTWQEKIDAWDAEADLEKQIANYENRKAKFEKEGRDFNDKRPEELRPGPIADKNRPGYMYASMIKPLIGVAVKGAIFHQGYNNCFDGSDGAAMYSQVFPEMISSWRSAFGDDAMPFGILSLCTAGDPQTEDDFMKWLYDAGPFIREAQHKTYRAMRDAGDETIGFTSTFDFRKRWYHPQIKVPAGERAAMWALATGYEVIAERERPLFSQPPVIENVTIADGQIQLDLNTDVKTKDESNTALLGFAIAGEDGLFFPAEAVYFKDEATEENKKPREYKNKVVLSSPHCAEPKFYRYAWARNPLANVVNKYGLPLPTQRNDNRALEETVPTLAPPEGMDENSVKRWMSGQAKKALEAADLERRIVELDALKPVVEKK